MRPGLYGVDLSLSFLLLLITNLVRSSWAEGKFITCLCTTKHCRGVGTHTCNTTNMCYTQFLDRKDGSDPVVRGCINEKTPLLCENRPPAVPPNKWPLLQCCSDNMCNQDGVPTAPPWHGTTTRSDMSFMGNSLENAVPDDVGSQPRIISPTYIAVLVVGICLLIIIGAVAMVVLRRQNRFYSNDFGIDRRSYLKGQCAHDLVSAKKLNDAENPKTGQYNGKGILAT